jgi:hypothetical protein
MNKMVQSYMQCAQTDQATANSEQVIFLFFETYYKWVILWKTNISESKIYTSPFQNVIKFGMNTGPIARYVSLPNFF